MTLPYTRSAVIGAIFLGLGRALGETMAVTFVLGNAHDLSASLLMPSNSIAAAIANEFTEADTDLYRSSLIALALPAVRRHLHRADHRQAAAAARCDQQMGRTQLMAIACSAAALADVVAFALRDAARPLFGLFWLVWILWTTLREGAAALKPALVHPDDPAAGLDGGLLNALYGSAVMIAACGRDRHADRHCRGHLSRRAWPPYAARASVRASSTTSCLSAPSIVIGLFVYELVVRTSGPFLGLCRRARAGDDPAPDRRPDHRESLRLVPDHDARGWLCARLAALEGDLGRSSTRRR